MSNQQQGAATRFDRLDGQRAAHLSRARECSSLTLPYLLPPEGSDDQTELATPWCAFLARCVNSLASKLVMTLMPPNSTCMRFMLPRQLRDMLEQSGQLQATEESLSKREWDVQAFMEKNKIRDPAHRAMRHLIVTGNVLKYNAPNNKLKLYRLDQYVVRRNGLGEPIEIIIKEPIAHADIPASCRQGDNKSTTEESSAREMAFLYTACSKLTNGNWTVYQEINGKRVPQSFGTYKEEDFPFHPLVWSWTEGENYGRGHVETYLGDFVNAEMLTKAIAESSAVGAKTVFLVNPNGITRTADLVDAPNGGFVTGMETDITTLKVEKQIDLGVAQGMLADLKESLSFAFLLHSAIQRNAERVTAEEIRWMAQDIENALGGIYSQLATTFQFQIVMWALKTMEKDKEIEPLPKELTVTVTTGLEALGRGHDLQKLTQFMGAIQSIPPDILQGYMKWEGVLSAVATALSLNKTDLVKTEQEVQQEQAQMAQQQQQNQIMDLAANSKVAGEVVKGQMNQ